MCKTGRAFASGFAFLLLALVLGMSRADAGEIPSFFALCYHNLEDKAPDQRHVGVSTGRFIEQMSWLLHNGYHAVSVDDIFAAQKGQKPLPTKAFLVTFDDGYESFYTKAFPILRAFRIPAVLAVEGNWLNEAKSGTVDYAGVKTPGDLFMTWAQVREVAASGLVEIASHTMDLHRGILANPQGNLEPAVVTRRYETATKAYESEAQYRARVARDGRNIASAIEREVGRRPRVTVWPYGEHSDLAISIMRSEGMPITMTLIDAPASSDKLAALPRHLVNNDPGLPDFVAELRDLSGVGPVRAVQVDLDYVYDPDLAQTDRNLGVLVQRIRDLKINTVFLEAFADPTGSGLAREVYFPNQQLPMRADLFNRAAWQLRTRAQVKVFAWLPVLAFDFGPGASTLQPVLALDKNGQNAAIDPKQYRRLSPFDPAARRKIIALYEDLARQASIDGLLFHDDALLSDFEDASPAALAAYRAAGFPGSIDAIRADPKLMARWTAFKTDALIAFTTEIADHVRSFRAPLRTARNLYARPVLDKESVNWFAQNYDRFLESYDIVAVMAMPRMENVADGDAIDWLGKLVDAARARKDGLKRTLFELQSIDWRKGAGDPGRDIASEEIASEMRFLERHGALNFGYYPDDFLHDHPKAALIHPAMSLQSHPYAQP